MAPLPFPFRLPPSSFVVHGALGVLAVKGRFLLAVLLFSMAVAAGEKPVLEWPPKLPDGSAVLSVSSPELLKPPGAALLEGVSVAQTPPRVDMLYYPGQDYVGKPWSNWGDACVHHGTYYSAIGDHLSPKGTARIFAYDAQAKALRLVADVKSILESSGLPAEMNYIPGKIHARLGFGSDGWLYFSTHRGSAKTTTDAFGYQGDWILRALPGEAKDPAKCEVVAAFPVPKHSLPAALIDSERLIFYAGTADGANAETKGVQFLAYDLKNRKVLKVEPGGFDRCAIFSRSTGKVFWRSAKGDDGGDDKKSVSAGQGKVYDPATNTVTACPSVPHVRSATAETADGFVYGTSGQDCQIWAFNVKTAELTTLANGAAGKCTYTTSMDADPTGRYLYYVPGAHGGGPADGSPVIQFDVKTKRPKVLAFLRNIKDQAGCEFEGTFSTALDEKGETLYVTWNVRRPPTARAWDCCALTVIHIPESERKP